MHYDNTQNFRKSWYSVSSPRHAPTAGQLRGDITTDVCIIGGGFTGLSAALELALGGYSVAVIEAGHGMSPDASGKNGGHVLRGLAKSPDVLTGKLGGDAARALCEMTMEGIDLIKQRSATYNIDCDFKTGHVTAALTPRHMRELHEEQQAWQSVGIDGMQLVDQRDLQDKYVRGHGYIGGLYDSLSGHFHPYAYAQGLAAAAMRHDAVLHDDTRATAIDIAAAKPVVTTHTGAKITASFVLVAGAINLPQMRHTLRRSISATAHMIATAPLTSAQAESLMPGDVAVADANFVMNYYRLSADRRLLFGGSCNYSGRELGFEHRELRARMAAIFPDLHDLAVDHCWQGPLDLTANRLPAVGRLAPTVFYAHGFGGHGVTGTNIMGKLMAEAISTTAARFDLFTRIQHVPFVGGTFTKRPLFMAGMLWYRLRDALRT